MTIADFMISQLAEVIGYIVLLVIAGAIVATIGKSLWKHFVKGEEE